MRTLVVLPTYNETPNIELMLRTLREVVPTCHILVAVSYTHLVHHQDVTVRNHFTKGAQHQLDIGYLVVRG